MFSTQMTTAIHKRDDGEYEGTNLVGAFVGQTHTHKNIEDLARWAAKGPEITLKADDETKKDADGWLRAPDNDCLRARGDIRWQEVNSLEARIRS